MEQRRRNNIATKNSRENAKKKQFQASEARFNSLKEGFRSLQSLVSGRTDVPDLFKGILENAVCTAPVEAQVKGEKQQICLQM